MSGFPGALVDELAGGPRVALQHRNEAIWSEFCCVISLVHFNEARSHRWELSNGHLRYKTVLQLLNLPQNIKQEICLDYFTSLSLLCSWACINYDPCPKGKMEVFPFPHQLAKWRPGNRQSLFHRKTSSQVFADFIALGLHCKKAEFLILGSIKGFFLEPYNLFSNWKKLIIADGHYMNHCSQRRNIKNFLCLGTPMCIQM